MCQARNGIQQCDLIVTENCTLRCKVCHIWKHKRDDKKISLKEYMEFMSDLKQFAGDKIQIQFVGGEPLLKKGIIELIQYAAREGFCTTMTTSGYLINRKMADEIVHSGLNTLGFSLESLREERHDFLRGTSGVQKRIMEAIDFFCKYPHLQLFISSIITRSNLDDIVELAEWVNRNKGINFIYFQAVMQPFAMPEDDNWYRGEEGAFLWPDTDKACKVLDDLIELKKKGYKISNQAAQLEIFKSYFKDPHRFIKKTKCNLGHKSFTVLPDGNIFLCLSMEPIGNIKKDKIDEVWLSEKADVARKQIASCRKNCKLMINCFFEEEHEGVCSDAG